MRERARGDRGDAGARRSEQDRSDAKALTRGQAGFSRSWAGFSRCAGFSRSAVWLFLARTSSRNPGREVLRFERKMGQKIVDSERNTRNWG
jgi:hypothetical protein